MTDVVQPTKAQHLAQLVRSEDFRSQVALALPDGMKPERFVRIMATGLLENPQIADKATQDSILRAGLKAAADGLVPDGREGAFVLFGSECVWMPMVGGFRRVAAEHGWELRSRVVYENDEFDWDGESVPVHRPTRLGQSRGEVIGAWAYAKHGDGRVSDIVVLDREEIEKIRSVSRSKDSGPWRDWYPQMCEAKAARRAFKKIPLADSDRVARLRAVPENGYDAAKELYGPNGAAALKQGETVDTQTGEISPAASGGQSAEPQQAEGADQVDSDSASSSPVASSVPEDDDPEPAAVAAATPSDDEAETAGSTLIPGGAYEGKTLAQVAAIGPEGEEYLAWMARNAGRSSVGPQVHAALQKFRPGLFWTGS